MPPCPIHTPRLRLEPQVEAHAPAMFRVLSDPALYTYENAPPASEATLAARFLRLESGRSADGMEQWLNWVVIDTTSTQERTLGFVQATIRADQSAYLAYVFASAYWGQGYATEAVSAMIERLRSDYDVIALVAVLKSRNIRSVRLLERLGFEPGTLADALKEAIEAEERVMLRLATRP